MWALGFGASPRIHSIEDTSLGLVWGSGGFNRFSSSNDGYGFNLCSLAQELDFVHTHTQRAD